MGYFWLATWMLRETYAENSAHVIYLVLNESRRLLRVYLFLTNSFHSCCQEYKEASEICCQPSRVSLHYLLIS